MFLCLYTPISHWPNGFILWLKLNTYGLSFCVFLDVYFSFVCLHSCFCLSFTDFSCEMCCIQQAYVSCLICLFNQHLTMYNIGPTSRFLWWLAWMDYLIVTLHVVLHSTVLVELNIGLIPKASIKLLFSRDLYPVYFLTKSIMASQALSTLSSRNLNWWRT